MTDIPVQDADPQNREPTQRASLKREDEQGAHIPRRGPYCTMVERMAPTPPLWTPDDLRETMRLLSLDEPEQVK